MKSDGALNSKQFLHFQVFNLFTETEHLATVGYACDSQVTCIKGMHMVALSRKWSLKIQPGL